MTMSSPQSPPRAALAGNGLSAAALRNELSVNGEGCCREPFHREILLVPSAGLLSHLKALLRMSEKIGESRLQSFNVSGRNHESSHSVLNELRQTTGIADDGRHPCRHSFGDGERQRVLTTGLNDYIGSGEKGCSVRLVPHKMDIALQPGLQRTTTQLLCL